MEQTSVVVLFGGRSSEHSISCATAGGVLRAIDRARFRVIPVGITRDGAFVLAEDDPDALALAGDALPEVTDNGSRILWPEGAADRGLRVREPGGHVIILGVIDVVFPILHGLGGEDGSIQGFLETLGLAYVGGGVLDSAICMDKHFMKIALQASSIPVAPWVTVTPSQWQHEPNRVRADAERLGFPMFVKPARAGSSVGVSKVHDASDLDQALQIAFAEDSKVLLETGVIGREIEVAVLGGTDPDVGSESVGARASLPGEIVLTTREFYDFEGKYLGGAGAEVVCPAQLGDDDIRQAQQLALRAFAAVDGRGLARVDFFLTEDGLIVNELNTMPGFTPISMFPKCWIASGMSYPELITELIALALPRPAR